MISGVQESRHNFRSKLLKFRSGWQLCFCLCAQVLYGNLFLMHALIQLSFCLCAQVSHGNLSLMHALMQLSFCLCVQFCMVICL